MGLGLHAANAAAIPLSPWIRAIFPEPSRLPCCILPALEPSASLLICALGFLLSLPNLAPRPKFLPSFVPWTQVHLGLDLRGGSYLLLQLDFNAVVQKQDLNTLVDETRQAMRGADLGYTGLHADPAKTQVVAAIC